MQTDEDTLRELGSLTEGYTGAEIEQIVISALYEAYFAERGLKVSDIKKAISLYKKAIKCGAEYEAEYGEDEDCAKAKDRLRVLGSGK